MTQYIDLDTPLELYVERGSSCKKQISTLRDLLDTNKIPYTVANVVEQKKGKWQITDAYPHNVYCSVCHKKFAQTHWAVWEDGSLPRNFCPNCGAQMDGGKI